MSQKPPPNRADQSPALSAADVIPNDIPRKSLSPEAQRALSEAAARRQAADKSSAPAPKEVNGPQGPEPTRYGDWETKGIASDF